MKLHSNPASPYGRKVKVFAHENGLIQRIPSTRCRRRR